ncbi:MAG: hypothetical protein GY784_00330 [Gammaproteobacteria bacterium]|nr:hypothetical protein [Gammaproteobacteria bacterium]
MKIYKTLLVVTSLLCSAQAMACSVWLNAKNETGETIDSISFAGPWGRYSDPGEVKDGDHYTYHAEGGAFTCHGEYGIDPQSGDPHCTMGTHNITMNSDGEAWFTIAKENNSDGSCNVTITRYKP